MDKRHYSRTDCYKPLAALYGGPDWYVSPQGSATGQGTIADPLSLSEVAGSSRIKPGHTIYLREGVYDPAGKQLTFTIAGTEAQPITLRNYAGETARIRIGVVQSGAHVHWKSPDYGLVIENTSTNRTSAISGSTVPADIDAWHAFTVNADDVKLINARIDNVLGAGVIWFHDHAGEVYGLVVHDTGWLAPDGAHGPGFYSSKDNADTPQRFENCVILNTFRGCVQLGDGGGSGGCLNYTAKNITAVNGVGIGLSIYSDGGMFDGLWIRHGVPTFGLYSPAYFGTGSNGSGQIANSLIDAGDDAIQAAFWAFQMSAFNVSNTLSAITSYINDQPAGGTGSVTITPASGQHAQLIINEYAPTFGTLRVFDFTDAGSVDVDVSALATSGTLRVRNPMLWSEYVDLTITAGHVTLTTTGWTTPKANGIDTLQHTVFSTRFGVWIVEKR